LLRLFQADTRLAPRDGAQIIVVAILQVRATEAQGPPDLRPALWERKIGRHDADDRVRVAVQQNHFADRAHPAAESRLPQSVSKDHASGPGPAFVPGSKPSAQGGRRA